MPSSKKTKRKKIADVNTPYNKSCLPIMAMNYVWFLASLKKQLKCSTAEKGKTFEIVMLSIKLSSPEEFVRMKRLNKINRKTCRNKQQ